VSKVCVIIPYILQVCYVIPFIKIKHEHVSYMFLHLVLIQTSSCVMLFY